ncbi:AbrB family transcriptional regulator [Ascidiaceihabitans sp.]|uniref:AbrB family transcriptional regulator n=1 Tax=Ascidiaceihabitans sp. TaxID=1872644 RepID=UPI0032969B5E
MSLSSAIPTLKTLGVGMGGACLARLLHMPLPDLTGPALCVSAAGLAGLQLGLDDKVRNIAFVILGMSVGAGMTAQATQMLVQLPLAFVALMLSTIFGLGACWWALVRFFKFDVQSGLLAASPGHLSFVLSIGAQYDLDLARITIVQSIRLLALTLITPVAALVLGVPSPAAMVGAGASMTVWTILILAALGYAASLVLSRINTPAPLLIGAMLVSMLGHGSGVTPGQMPLWLAVPAFVVLGTLIGTRFGGVSVNALRAAAIAGLMATLITTATAAGFAVLTAALMGMDIEALLIAFAPGGLETMVAMSIALGIAPGFVAACHLARLLVLSVAVPLLFARTQNGAGR